jgi:hypothetical protein
MVPTSGSPTLSNYQKRWALVLIALLVWYAFCFHRAKADDTVSDASLGPATALDCPFYRGWNLVVPTDTPYEVPECISAVWRYEAEANRWYFWGRKSQVFGVDLIEFQADKSYWVYR